MSSPIKPYVQKTTLMQLDLDGYSQTIEVSVESAGNGHYAVLRTDLWEVDMSELDELVRRIKQMIADADEVWGEPVTGGDR